MDKKEFSLFLEGIFKRYNFNKKGDGWFMENEELIKEINLQKSKYGNNYYINYGYILKKIELGKLKMHIFKGLGSYDEKDNKRIKELLDFDTSISDEIRKHELECFIGKNILENIESVNTEKDILNYLKMQPDLNEIPLVVKKYFKFE